MSLSNAGKLFKRAFTSSIKTAARTVETACVSIFTVVVALPEILIAIPILILFPILTYHLSEYIIFYFFITLSISRAAWNLLFFFWNQFAPLALPILFAGWNMLLAWIISVVQTIYYLACPNGLHNDLNNDCAPLMNVVNQIISMIQDVFKLAVKFMTAMGEVLKELQNSICDPNNNVAVCSGSNSGTTQWTNNFEGPDGYAEEMSYRKRLFVALTGDDEGGAWGFVIMIFHDVGIIFAKIFPIVLLTLSGCLDIAWINIRLYTALLAGLFNAVITLFSGALDQIHKNDPAYPDKSTQKTAYKSYIYNAVVASKFDPNKSFLKRSPGPDGVRNILMRLVQIYSDVIYIVFNVVASVVMTIDKSICYVINPGGCLFNDVCHVVFEQYLDIKLGLCPAILPICIDISGAIVDLCDWVTGGYECICNYCDLAPDSLVYDFLRKKVPCNPQMATESGICCADTVSFMGLLINMFGGL